MWSRFRLVFSFFALPMVVVGIYPLFRCVIVHLPVAEYSECTADFTFFAFYGWPIAVFGVLVFGVPIFVFLRHFNLLNWWHVGVSGAVAGIAFSVIIDIVEDSVGSWAVFSLFLAPVCFLSGLVFWLTALFGNDAIKKSK